jgi:hypothetical protein
MRSILMAMSAIAGVLLASFASAEGCQNIRRPLVTVASAPTASAVPVAVEAN